MVLGAPGAPGLTSASLLTRLKDRAQSLTKRIWLDAYTDLIAAAVTEVLEDPNGLVAAGQRRTVAKASQDRRLTTGATPG